MKLFSGSALMHDKEPRFPDGILAPERPVNAVPRRRFNGRLGLNGKKMLAYTGSAILLLIAALAGVFSYKSERNRSVHNAYDGNAQQQDGVILYGAFTEIDVYQRNARCDWLYVGYGSYTDSEGEGGPVNTDLTVYYNGQPEFAGQFFASHESEYLQQGFSTYHRTSAAANKLQSANSISYPFDQYSFNTSIALSAGQNQTAQLIRAIIASTPQGWSIEYKELPAPYVGPSFSGQGVVVQIKLQRSSVVKVFVVMLIILMWLISLSVLYTSINAMILGRGLWASAGMSATILFALPAVRNVCPDVPAFGTYADVCGFLINEIVVGLCLVSLFLFHHSHEDGSAPPSPAKPTEGEVNVDLAGAKKEKESV